MKKISESELEILKVIWNKKIATSSDIIEEVIDNNWTNNTVRTLIKRLLAKDAIEVVGKKNKSYFYKAKLNQDKYKYLRVRGLTEKLFDGKFENLVVNYIKHDKKELEKLKKTIKYLESKE